MKKLDITRRGFLMTVAAAGMATMVACPLIVPGKIPVAIFRRSGKGRHVSNAAKKHNANRLYATSAAAALDLAHPGDKSKVVQLTISQQEFDRLFPNGALTADLRHRG